jgi:hypothetical protein
LDGFLDVLHQYQADNKPRVVGTKTVAQAKEPFKVKVGSGLEIVLQLDDRSMCKHFGVTVSRAGRRHIYLEGDRKAMESVLVDCESRGWGSGWDQPKEWVRSSRTAARVIQRALGKAVSQ